MKTEGRRRRGGSLFIGSTGGSTDPVTDETVSAVRGAPAATRLCFQSLAVVSSGRRGFPAPAARGAARLSIYGGGGVVIRCSCCVEPFRVEAHQSARADFLFDRFSAAHICRVAHIWPILPNVWRT